METKILWKPSYSCLQVTLNDWETIKVEPGAMVAMEPTAEIDWKMEGWFFGSLWRIFLTWESFFTTRIKARKDGSNVFLAPRSVWDIETLEVSYGKNWIVQGWGFLCSTENVETSSKFEWLRWFFSWEGLFMIKVSWEWKFWVSSFWAILEYELDWTNNFIVDNAHIVAFEDSLTYNIKQAWGIISWIKTWEWLVCEFSWKWKIYFQTRNIASFTETLNPFLSNKSSSEWNAWLLGKVFG